MTRKIRQSNPLSFPTHDLDAFRSRPLPATGEQELLALAGSPDSDPEVLLTIWLKSHHDSVKHALARNPATPVNALLRLWAFDPGAILENPIVILWEFTDPASLQKILPASLGFRLYQFLLDRPEYERHRTFISEEEVVRLLGKKYGCRLKVPAHRVVRDERSSVRLALLQQTVRYESKKTGRPVDFPASAIDALAADSSKPVLQALALALAKGWIRPEPFESVCILRLAWHLRSSGESSIYRPIAQWPFLDAELVELLASGADEELIAVLVRHPKASLDFQTRMVAHESAVVRASVAASACDELLLRRLFIDRNPLVRCGLASSPQLPSDLQWPLFESRDSRVLLALLRNPCTTPEILEKFAGLSHLGIERLLGQHPNTPPHIRDKPYPCFPEHSNNET